MMVDMIWQLPRIREETDKIDLIALEAPDKLSTATIEATIKSQKAQRVSAALAGIGQSAARKCDFLSYVTMRCHVKFMCIWSGVLPSERIGTGRPVSAARPCRYRHR
jgi:hypothetical protein